MKPLIALTLAVALGFAARAADSAGTTEVRTKETSGRTYLCLKKEIKFAEMKDFAVEAITELFQKATDLKLGQGGPVMFTYFNFMGDPEQKFTAEIALPILKKEAEQLGGAYIRQTTKFKCASTIYQGSLANLGEAWHSFAQTAMSKGEFTGESREFYLYFESAESPNNIVELQMGLK
jgi:effector-binding domain-containing protein